MTVQGRSKDTTRAISKSDARLGVESSHDWIDSHGPQFIDFPFTADDATFQDHLAVVRETRPTLAVAPDIEKDRDSQAVYEQADRLAQYVTAERGGVIVVPKSVHPSTVPDRFRVGVPLADFGSGAPWGVWDYQDCGPVHLLGGGPARQLTVRNHVSVASVDTATLGKRCRFGMWDGKSVDAPNGWDYERRLKESLNNYAAVWCE